ncbi:hypothetical protein FP830_04910 [Candidatus Falkowbacteria bacterium]|nr:hypothetical protein [Candidatus Falkowbacteria bacterium]
MQCGHLSRVSFISINFSSLFFLFVFLFLFLFFLFFFFLFFVLSIFTSLLRNIFFKDRYCFFTNKKTSHLFFQT